MSYLPALGEGQRVDPESINGVANDAFLTGDGAIGYTLELKSATSSFHNSLGVYKIAADGTIFDAHIVFADTLTVAAGARTIDLGAPGDGVQIGFFLIQDGAISFAKLPDNLSFVTPDGHAANVDGGQPVLLMSASLGVLTGATVFHAVAELNPGGADQVLSGIAPGGHELLVGFEDLPSASGDNDFQDVVVAVHVVSHGTALG